MGGVSIMNYCIINRHRLYPSVSNNIKVTYENPLIKDRDAQTMEIEFPLSIQQNRDFFGSPDRLEVSKPSTVYDSAALYAGDLLVISGKATVTDYTSTSVKLQIKSGLSVAEFSDYEDTYIDQLSGYPMIYYKGQYIKTTLDFPDTDGSSVTVELYKLPVVYDETNSVYGNLPCLRAYTDSDGQRQWKQSTFYPILPQPNLLMVVRSVLSQLGYTLQRGILHQSPWRNLYILNYRPGITLQQCLPHWSVKTLLQQLRRLFNVAVVIDEQLKTATLTPWADEQQTDAYEAADDFSTDYDEDGIEYLGSSNISYNLSDSGEWTNPDIPEETLSAITVREYATIAAVLADDTLTDTDRQLSLFRIKNADIYKPLYCHPLMYYIHSDVTNDGGQTTVKSDSISLMGRAGLFQHLTRESGSESEVQLLMVPAAIAFDEEVTSVRFYPFPPGDKNANWTAALKLKLNVVTSTNDQTTLVQGETAPGDTGGLITVEDILDYDTSTTQDEAERMELFFIDPSRTAYAEVTEKPSGLYSILTYDYTNFPEKPPIPHVTVGYPGREACGSFVLDRIPTYNGKEIPSIRSFHAAAKQIDNHVQIVAKIKVAAIPDPKHQFLIRGKRYIADKVEITVTQRGLSPIATAYLYEIVNS